MKKFDPINRLPVFIIAAFVAVVLQSAAQAADCDPDEFAEPTPLGVRCCVYNVSLPGGVYDKYCHNPITLIDYLGREFLEIQTYEEGLKNSDGSAKICGYNDCKGNFRMTGGPLKRITEIRRMFFLVDHNPPGTIIPDMTLIEFVLIYEYTLVYEDQCVAAGVTDCSTCNPPASGFAYPTRKISRVLVSDSRTGYSFTSAGAPVELNDTDLEFLENNNPQVLEYLDGIDQERLKYEACGVDVVINPTGPNNPIWFIRISIRGNQKPSNRNSSSIIYECKG